MTSVLTVRQAFDEYLSRIELNPARIQTASQRYNAVKTALEAALPGKTVKRIGSFQRATKIRPIDLGDGLDVDMLVVYRPFTKFAGPGEKSISPSDMLTEVRSALKSNDVYRVMDPKSDAPVVTLEYSDLDEFKVEIVPAFIDHTGQHSHGNTGIDCYIVPGRSGSWQVADYDWDAMYVSVVNQSKQSNQTLVPLIKTVKAYFRSAEIPIGSFHTDVLVTKVMQVAYADWAQRDAVSWAIQHAFARFLSDSSEQVKKPIRLPDSFSPPVDSGLSSVTLIQIATFLEKKAEEAWTICDISDDSKAVQAWGLFLGSPFPGA
jgi:hypothetical protein